MENEQQTEQQVPEQEAQGTQPSLPPPPPAPTPGIRQSQPYRPYYPENRSSVSGARITEFLYGLFGAFLLDILAVVAMLIKSDSDDLWAVGIAIAAMNVLALVLGFTTGHRGFAIGVLVHAALAAVPLLAIGACFGAWNWP